MPATVSSGSQHLLSCHFEMPHWHGSTSLRTFFADFVLDFFSATSFLSQSAKQMSVNEWKLLLTMFLLTLKLSILCKEMMIS